VLEALQHSHHAPPVPFAFDGIGDMA
jgi:hypothetical protein